jgi:SAM-dependent methyltransferase
MDATQLAIAPASIDIVLQAFVLFHLPRPLEALREARRVLTSGGEIGCITWGGELESPATRVWTECLDEHGAQPIDDAIVTRHDAVDSPSKMEALLREAGFHKIRCWSEQLQDRIDAERLIRLRTRMGSCKPRFDSLDETARAACRDAARVRMERLSTDGFIARGEVVYSLASA